VGPPGRTTAETTDTGGRGETPRLSAGETTKRHRWQARRDTDGRFENPTLSAAETTKRHRWQVRKQMLNPDVGLLNPIVIEFLTQHPTPLIIARQSLLSFIQSRVESQSSSGLKTIVTTSPIELSIGLTVS